MGFFPLSMVVLPGEVKELHIFEKRYIQLFTELEVSSGQFAVIPAFNQEKAQLGTVCRLRSIEQRFDRGRMNVKIEGLQLVQVNSFNEQFSDRLYPGGSIKPFSIPSFTTSNQKVIRLLAQMAMKLKIDLVGFNAPSIDLLHMIAQFDLDDIEKLSLLQSKSLEQFEIRLINFMRLQLNMAGQEMKLGNRIMWN